MTFRVLRVRLKRCLALAALVPPGLAVTSAHADELADQVVVRAEPGSDRNHVLEEQLAGARLVVIAAKRLFVAGHFEAALAEYSRVYDMLAGHPRQYWVLHNLAACNERLFRYDVAVTLYEEYLRRAPTTETDRTEVLAVVHTLRSLLATLVIDAAVSGEVWLDDRRLGMAPGRWLVPAGRHIVEVRADRYGSQRREVQLVAGQARSEGFELRRLSTYAGPGRGYFWAATALTGAALVAGATFGVQALSASDAGQERAELYLDTRVQEERTGRWAVAADASFGAALVFGATATVLYFVTDWSEPGEPGAARLDGSTARLTAGVSLGARGSPGATFHLGF